MKHEHYSLVNHRTGEIVQEYTSKMVPSRRKANFTDYAMIDLTKFTDMSNVTLPSDHRVLWCVLSNVGFKNEITKSQAEIGEELGMSKEVVSRSMKRLEELGYVIKGRKRGNMNVWYVSPGVAWKGNKKDHSFALKEFIQGRMWD